MKNLEVFEKYKADWKASVYIGELLGVIKSLETKYDTALDEIKKLLKENAELKIHKYLKGRTAQMIGGDNERK